LIENLGEIRRSSLKVLLVARRENPTLDVIEGTPKYRRFLSRLLGAFKQQIRELTKNQAFIAALNDGDIGSIGRLMKPLDFFFPIEEFEAFLIWAAEFGTISARDKIIITQQTNRLERIKVDSSEGFVSKEAVTLIRQRSPISYGEMDESTLKQISGVIARGFRDGLNTDDTVTNLTRKWSTLSAHKADVMVRTEIAFAVSASENSQFKDLGVIATTFTTVGDDRVCPVCFPLDGTTIQINGKFPVEGGFGNQEFPPLHFLCYDDKTELYTDEGWKDFSDLKGNEKVLSLNPETFELEWQPYIRQVRYSYKGKMISFKSRGLNLLVTPDHQMFVGARVDRGKKGRNVEWDFVKAQELMEKVEFRIPRTGKWTGKSRKSININGLKIDAKTFCYFMGYYLSEGSTVKRGDNWYQTSIHQQGDEGRDYIYEHIKEMPVKVNRGVDKIYINNVQLGKYLKQFGKSFEKFVPKEIKELDKDLIGIFLDAYCYGDGYTATAKWSEKNLVSTARRYFTSSKKMAEDIGELLLKFGKHPSFRCDPTKGKEQKFSNGTYIINHDTWVVFECHSKTAIGGKDASHGVVTEEVDYDGEVFCIELPKNHVFWVRRNGQTAFSGNCRCYTMPVFQDISVDILDLPAGPKPKSFITPSKLRKPKKPAPTKELQSVPVEAGVTGEPPSDNI